MNNPINKLTITYYLTAGLGIAAALMGTLTLVLTNALLQPDYTPRDVSTFIGVITLATVFGIINLVLAFGCKHNARWAQLASIPLGFMMLPLFPLITPFAAAIIYFSFVTLKQEKDKMANTNLEPISGS